jgi:transcription elongation factor S-II
MATMDGKTLFSTGKQIQKAIESGDSGESLLNILQPLTKWTATEDLLRQSKIGVIVSKLRQQKDPKVVEQASKLVNKWKQDVNASKKKAASGSPAPSAAAAKSNAATNGKSSATSSPAPPAVAVKKEQTKKSTADPAKRNSQVDGVNTTVTGNQTRDACVKLMYDGLAFMSEEGTSILCHTPGESNADYSQIRQTS